MTGRPQSQSGTSITWWQIPLLQFGLLEAALTYLVCVLWQESMISGMIWYCLQIKFECHGLECSVKVYNTEGVIFVGHITKLCLHNSGDTLQNCTLELATLGDLKLVEKPQPVVLAPRDFCNIKANVKVASTENGIIFGNIGECVY